MRKGLLCGVMASVAVALAGMSLVSCGRSEEAPPPGTVAVEVKGNVLHVEIASTPGERSRGLQGRTKLAEDAGMVFIFNPPEKVVFWMDETLIPLSIAFMDGTGRIMQIEDMEPMTRTEHPSASEVTYTLEVNQGWFERHGVKVGDVVDLSQVTMTGGEGKHGGPLEGR
jgi:uncharacterized protein